MFRELSLYYWQSHYTFGLRHIKSDPRHWLSISIIKLQFKLNLKLINSALRFICQATLFCEHRNLKFLKKVRTSKMYWVREYATAYSGQISSFRVLNALFKLHRIVERVCFNFRRSTDSKFSSVRNVYLVRTAATITFFDFFSRTVYVLPASIQCNRERFYLLVNQ